MNNIIDDLSVLTGIAKYNIENLVNVEVSIISHSISESLMKKENTSCIDIGVGILNIISTSEGIQYKFIPSKKLENSVVNTYRTGKSQLVQKIDTSLGKKISNTYKELF